jgi:hypothetical protein
MSILIIKLLTIFLVEKSNDRFVAPISLINKTSHDLKLQNGRKYDYLMMSI